MGDTNRLILRFYSDIPDDVVVQEYLSTIPKRKGGGKQAIIKHILLDFVLKNKKKKKRKGAKKAKPEAPPKVVTSVVEAEDPKLDKIVKDKSSVSEKIDVQIVTEPELIIDLVKEVPKDPMKELRENIRKDFY